MRVGTEEHAHGQPWVTGPTTEQPASRNGGQHPAGPAGSAEIQAAVAAERARIAREIDDAVSKSLLGVSILASSLASAPRAADLRALDQRLRELTRLARRAVSDARSVINDLREEALTEEVRSIATAWGIFTGVNVSLELAPESQASARARCEILADLREALRNVEQHARAGQVRVCLRRVDEQLLLAIADDGVGFRPPADLAELRDIGCSGLNGMNERARRLGGRLNVESRPGRGTRLQIEIHAPAPARKQLPVDASATHARVIIADSNPVLRTGLRTALGQAADIDVIAEAGTGEEAVALVREHHPDVVLLDSRMPLPAGSATIRQISPLTRVVMLTCLDDANLVMGAVAAGASGCVLRGGEFEPSELIRVVLDAARQRPSPVADTELSPAGSPRAALGRVVSHPLGLRPRELEIMGLIAEGLSNRQIAAHLVITEKTVKNHICSIYQRFAVSERSQAVSRWREFWSA
ncbi:MAG TPA: response regulator [Streptosporangiaceae bacterium]|jgi:DNA-binding NarL/FixJ family response regulator/anti-sigma regulatory factor (Ser/Thr protein kinase)